MIKQGRFWYKPLRWLLQQKGQRVCSLTFSLCVECRSVVLRGFGFGLFFKVPSSSCEPLAQWRRGSPNKESARFPEVRLLWHVWDLKL